MMLIGKKYIEEKKDPVRHFVGRTAEQIAKETGVCSRTVERAGEYATALDTIEQNTGKEVKDKILSGEIKCSK